MIRKFAIAIAALVALAGLSWFGVSTSNRADAAVAKPACITRIHYATQYGNAGFIREYQTCGGGNHDFRAHAECFNDNGTGKGIYRNGAYRTKNNKDTTAGCKNGTYIDNGGYQYKGYSKYYVLWRYTGEPL